MDDRDLIRRGQTGDQEAFGMLVEQHRKVLFGTAYLMTRDHGLAEDAVQEALVQMWQHLPSLRSEGSFKTWMARIVVNEVNEQQRKQRAPTAPLEEAAELGGDPEETEKAALQKEERRRMNRALGTLPEDQRRAVVLRYYADLKVPEIARALGCREGTVKSRLSRALDNLALVLGGRERRSGLGPEG